MSKRFEKGLFWRQNDAREDEEEGGIDWNDFPQHATWPNPNETLGASEAGSATAKTPETSEKEAFAKGSANDFPQRVTWPDLKETQVSSEGGTPVAKTSVASEKASVADRAAWSKFNETTTVGAPDRPKNETVAGEATDFSRQVTWPDPNETLGSSERGSPAAKMPETSETDAVAEATSDKFQSDQKYIPRGQHYPEPKEFAQQASDNFFVEDLNTSDMFQSYQKDIPRGQQYPEPEELAQQAGAQFPGAVAVGTAAGSHDEESTMAETIIDSKLPHVVSARLVNDQEDVDRNLFHQILEERANAPLAIIVGDVDTPTNTDVSESESGPSRWGPKRRRLGLIGGILLTAVIVLVVVLTQTLPRTPASSRTDESNSPSPSLSPSPSQMPSSSPTIGRVSPSFVTSLLPSLAPSIDSTRTPMMTSSPVVAAVPSLPPTTSPVLTATPTMTPLTMLPSVLGPTTLPAPSSSPSQTAPTPSLDTVTSRPTATSPALSPPSPRPTPLSSMTPVSPAPTSLAPSPISPSSGPTSLSPMMPASPAQNPSAPSAISPSLGPSSLSPMPSDSPGPSLSPSSVN